MSAILHSLNVHNLHIFHPILMILLSKVMVHRALSDKTYLSLGLLSPLSSLKVSIEFLIDQINFTRSLIYLFTVLDNMLF